MKTVIISDLHGKDVWKKILDNEKDFDKVIFLGDYFDSFDETYLRQLRNFEDILNFKNEQPDKVKLLLGNHELHYVNYDRMERYSGFQLHQYFDLKYLLEPLVKNKTLTIAHYEKEQEQEVVYTHAGISYTWLKHNKLLTYKSKPFELVNKINNLFLENMKPFYINSFESFSGQSKNQSPLWIRPASLCVDLEENNYYYFKQIVGHTKTEKLDLNKYIGFINTDVYDNIKETGKIEYLIFDFINDEKQFIKKTIEI